jgi:hypothetical protein
MNQTLPTLTRDCTATLALLVLGTWWVGGAELAFATSVSGVVAIVNVLLLAIVVRVMTRAAAAERGAGLALGLLAGKSLFVLVAFGLLVSTFGSIAPAIGAGSVVLALTLRGFADALLVSDDELPEGAR